MQDAGAQPELTFVLTDVEGSTAIWERAPAEMTVALARHDEIIHGEIARRGGEHKQARGEGDSHFAVFASADSAVECALQIQRAIAQESWPDGAELAVRIGIHSGPAELRDGDYYGSTVNRAARLRAIAHGGQTVISGAVVDAVRAPLDPGLTLRDRGHHRLKDLEEPLRVFELAHPDLRSDFPALKSLDGRRHSLPFHLTSFIGREDEISLVGKAFRDGTRLLTLAGGGGAGKTRLATQAAADVLDFFPDGVWLAELANVNEPERVVQEVARAVGAPSESEPLEDLVTFLSPRSCLVFLDNCEHVLDDAAVMVSAVLRACPDVSFLTTSREPLRVAGEKVLRISGMPTPESELDPLAEAYPAVRLFAERADAVAPAFVLSGSTAAAVVRICRRLDGLPLAIELAAARASVLTPEQIDERLHRRFELLSGGPRTADARQRTMRGAIDWSHDLLGDDERVLFRRLGVFTGGCTLEAAEAVGGTPPIPQASVLEVLSGLVDKSLVVADVTGGATRYRMLESILEYARERLEAADELKAVQDAHLRWIAARTGARLAPDVDRAGISVALFREEADNIRSALDHAVRHDPVAGLTVMWNTMEAWDSYSHSYEGLGRVRALLEKHPVRDAARLYGLSLLGILARKRGVLDVARAALEEAVGTAREQSHDERLAANLVALAELSHYDGRLAEGEDRLAEAEQIARKADHPSGLAHVLTGMGRLTMERDAVRSVALLEEALRVRRQLGERSHVQALLENLTSMYERQGRASDARRAAQEAKELAAAAGDEESVTALALSIGRIAQDEGRFDDAEACFREVLTLAQDKGLPNEEGYAWALLGENSRALNDVDAAKDYYSRARECFDRAGNVVTVSFLNGNLGHIALGEGDVPLARELALSALRTAAETDTMSGVVEFLELAAEVEVASGRPRSALRLFGAAEGLREEVGAARDLVDQADYDRAIAAARADIPAPDYETIWETGRSEGAAALTEELLAPGWLSPRPDSPR